MNLLSLYKNFHFRFEKLLYKKKKKRRIRYCRCIHKVPLHASIINQTQLTEKLKREWGILSLCVIFHLSNFINSFSQTPLTKKNINNLVYLPESCVLCNLYFIIISLSVYCSWKTYTKKKIVSKYSKCKYHCLLIKLLALVLVIYLIRKD